LCKGNDLIRSFFTDLTIKPLVEFKLDHGRNQPV
jgi:hypothetical protein